MNKEDFEIAISKRLPDMTDKEIAGIITIPEPFWSTNVHNYTLKTFNDEKDRRIAATNITFDDVLKDVVYLSTLKNLAFAGPRIHSEVDELGIELLYEEIRKLEPKVKKKIRRFNEQKK